MQRRSVWHFLSLLVLLAMVFSVVPLNALAATTGTILDENITVTSTRGTLTVSDNTVTVKNTISGFSLYTGYTFTIKNTSGGTADISFDYNFVNFDNYSTSSRQGTYTTTRLGNDESITLTASSQCSNGQNDTLTLSNFVFTPVVEADVTVNYDSDLGSVTAAGSAISAGGVTTVEAGGSVVLAATANSGSTFLGWINEADNALLSENSSFTLEPAASMRVRPVFVGPDDSTPWFAVGSAEEKSYQHIPFVSATYYYHIITNAYLFGDLGSAASFAQTSTYKYIVLLNSGTLPAGNYTISSGVTLLIPFDSNQTLFTSSAIDDTSSSTYSSVTCYRKLTMADGAKLTVNGALSLSNRVCLNSTRPTGPCSFIQMEEGSSITVGGSLYAYGFISGSGSITANSGSTIYECFQMMDWRGGTDTTAMTDVFPLSQYYIQNIEVPLTLKYGATEKCFAAMDVTAIGPVGSFVTIMGKADALFLLGDSNTSVTKTYIGSTDRLKFDVEGTLTIAPVTLSISGYELNTGEFTFGMNNNFVIEAHSGAKLYAAQNIAFVPGTQMYINEGAYFYITDGASIYVYDGDEWGPYCSSSNQYFVPLTYAPGRTYNRTASADLGDALFLVNGTLDVSAGYLYTTESGANICSTGAGTVIQRSGSETYTLQFRQNIDSDGTDEYVQIPIVLAYLKNANGTYVHSQADTYTYDLEQGRWLCGTHSWTKNDCPCTVCGTHQEDCDCNFFSFYATNVNLSNNLDMLFAMDANIFDDLITDENSNYYAVFTRADHEPVVVYSSEWETITINGKKCYVVAYGGFAAKEMCDTVYVHIYDSQNNRISECKNDGIRAYALRVLEKTQAATDEVDVNLRRVIVDMLHYGAACQTYFGYNTDNLANAGITATGSDYSMGSSDGISNKYFIGSNLVTTSNIQFALKATEAFTSSMTATYSFTNHWGTEVTGELAYNAEEDYYYIDALVVADAASEITVTVNDDTNNVYTDSIKAYCERMYNSNTATENQKNTFLTFMKFASSAKSYLHSKYSQEG